MNANNFLKYCMGVALVCGTLLFGTAALIYTTSPAQADAPTATNEAGRYMMSMQSMWNPKAERTNWYVLVWDTTSGKSKFYYGNTSMKEIVAANSSYNLPSYPL